MRQLAYLCSGLFRVCYQPNEGNEVSEGCLLHVSKLRVASCNEQGGWRGLLRLKVGAFREKLRSSLEFLLFSMDCVWIQLASRDREQWLLSLGTSG